MKRTLNHIKALLIVLAFGCLLPCLAYAQGIATIKAGFDKYAQTIPREKIFAHTDRQFYLAGEVIWFKLYTVDANTSVPANMSKVAYVDILNDANISILQGKIGLKHGLGNGSFYIPNTVINGHYKLRAYTAWMKNFSAELYFEKQITIVNPLVSPDAPLTQPAIAYDVQFFPEGGALVNGLPGTVGFKAVGSDGKSVDVAGAIVNNAKDTVARFKSVKFGMGHFSFTPAGNDTYTAIVKIGRTAITKNLPTVATKGYAMQVTDAGAAFNVKITGDAQADPSRPLYLLAHQGAVVNIAQVLQSDAAHTYTFQVDKSKLGGGVNHLTLFDADQHPVNERLIFKRPSPLNLQATVQTQYGTRKKVDVNISSANSAQPLAANLSLAVYRADDLNGIPDADIASYLSLTSELRGHIESPGYYFNNVTSATDAALDDLLLSQGWSLFNWADVLTSEKPKFRFLPEYNGHLINGQATYTNGAPARYAVVYLAAIGKTVQLYGANSGGAGRLMFNTANMYGPGEVVLQTNPKLDTNTYRISITNPFSEEFSAIRIPSFFISKASSALLQNNNVGMQAQNLYKPERLYVYNAVDSSLFYNDQYQRFKLDHYVRYITIDEVLREYVKNAFVAKQGKHFHVKIMDARGFYLDEGKEDPLVLLDGVPVFDLDKAFSVDPLKITQLDVVNQKYYWGPIKANGIIALNSYKNDFGGLKLDPKAIVLDYEGLQLPRRFYSPVYDTGAQQASRLPDFRNLLYWSPDVNTGADGKAQVSFYTPDKAGKYIGVVQGLSVNGASGSGTFVFDVVK